MSPRAFEALVDRWTRNQLVANFRFGMVAAAFLNVYRDSDEDPLLPFDIMTPTDFSTLMFRSDEDSARAIEREEAEQRATSNALTVFFTRLVNQQEEQQCPAL